MLWWGDVYHITDTIEKQTRQMMEADERHQAKLQADAERTAAMEEQRVDMLRRELSANEFSKRQCLLLFDVSCRLKQLNIDDGVPRFVKSLCELIDDFESIVSDAITDLLYKNLYAETGDVLRRVMKDFELEHSGEFDVFRRYHHLWRRHKPYLGGMKITSAEEFHRARRLIGDFRDFYAGNPDFAPDEAESVQKCMDVFAETVAKAKGMARTFKYEELGESRDVFVFLLCDYLKIADDIFSDGMWRESDEIMPSASRINDFCRFCAEAMDEDRSIADAVLRILDAVEDSGEIPVVVMLKQQQHSALIKILKQQKFIAEGAMRQYKKLSKTAWCFFGCLGALLCFTGLLCWENKVAFCIVFSCGIFLVLITASGVLVDLSKEKAATHLPMSKVSAFLKDRSATP